MNKHSLISRKNDHLDIVLDPERTARAVRTGFEAVVFEHCALPELHLDDINLHTDLFGHRLRAPLLISSMTGGALRSAAINAHLAQAAQRLGIAMAVGSQRVALETTEDQGLTSQLRRLAPDILLLANLGAAQLVAGYGEDEALRAVDMIEADALILHLNPLQEAVQPGGDRNWCGVLTAIEKLTARLPVPVVVKEVGAGLSASVARQLVGAGVAALDVAGAGGTSWAAVEAERATTEHEQAVASAFADWGIPTAMSLRAVHKACPDIPLIASGGIGDGLDVAKAIRLGADIVGQAAGVLRAAMHSSEAVEAHFQVVIDQLRIACFCTGSADLAALRQAPLLCNEGS